MSNILKDLNPKSITEAIENNFNNYIVELGKNANKDVCLGEKMKWVITRPSSWPNYIFDVQFDKYNVEENIKQLLKQIEVGNAPADAEFLIGPKLNHPDYSEYLKKYDYKILRREDGMFIDLLKLNESFYNPNNFNIKEVNDKKALKGWMKTASSIFTEDMGGSELEIDLFENSLFKKNTSYFVSSINEKIVGISVLFLSSGVAGLYWIGTESDYRNKGIGTSMTMAGLLKAKSMGYFIGVLSATEAGSPIYERIGFKKICDFDTYIRNT